MTISSTIRIAGPYSGTGSQQIFPFSYKVFTATDLLVILTDPTGINTTQTLTSQYTVSLNADQNATPGGTITMLVAPAAGYQLTLSSQVPNLQPTNLANVGNFYPQSVTDALDRATIEIQQLAIGVANSLQLPITSTGVNTTMPNPAANQLLGWNATGTALVNINPTSTATGAAVNVTYTGVDGLPVYRVQDMSSNTNALKGDALIGHINLDASATSVQVALWNYAKCDSIFALLSVAAVANRFQRVASYHTTWQTATNKGIGGGQFVYVSTLAKNLHNGGTIISPTVPWDGTQANLSAFLAGTGETLPAGNGCWVRIYTRFDVTMFGARGDNTNDDTAAFQKAMDTMKEVFVPNNTYLIAGQLLLKANGTALRGENQTQTYLNCTSTGTVLKSNVSGTTTLLFCELTDMKITAVNNSGTAVVDWASIQFGKIDRVWLQGKQVVSCVLINMSAVWTVTEGTYNTVSRCYFGNCATCISVSDGANNLTFSENRMQPGLSGGIGILLSGTVAGRVSSISIRDNGFEFPGQVSTGVNILQNCTGVRVTGNRFEALNNGIVIGSTANLDIFAPHDMSYFSGCVTDINLSAGGTGTTFMPVAGGTWNGITASGNVNNLTISNPSTGNYVFAFTGSRTTMLDAGYCVLPSSSAFQTSISAQSTSGFTISTFNAAGAAVTASQVSCQVFYNK